MIKAHANKRIFACICIMAMLVLQVVTISPVFAETAGDVLVVRVQYYGESGSKIREKARFSREELEAMGASEQYFSNVTRVGTVMVMAAYGPAVLDIIEQSGIDLGSVKNVTFRTTDGYTRNFTIEKHLAATRYFYPNLSFCYERDGGSLIPLEGFDEGKTTVPAILALTFGATKVPDTDAAELEQGTEETYRFCIGQGNLKLGKPTNPKAEGTDVTSLDSCHSIYGVDITLAGSPAKSIGLDIGDKNIKVGSTKKISATIMGDELFADDFGFDVSDLKWSSSDTSIATVDQNGKVTIKKKGVVTITATAPNGLKASITINGVGGEEKSQKSEKKNSAAVNSNAKNTTAKLNKEKKTTVKAGTIVVKEVMLGDQIVPETSMADEDRTQQMASDATELDAAEEYSRPVAAGTAGAFGVACAAGVVFRVRRYHLDK